MNNTELTDKPKILDVVVLNQMDENLPTNIPTVHNREMGDPKVGSKLDVEEKLPELPRDIKEDLKSTTSSMPRRQLRSSTMSQSRENPEMSGKANLSRSKQILPDFVEYGTMKFRLTVLGLKIDIDRPEQSWQWYTEFYNNFEGRYWKRIKRRGGNLYACMICNSQYRIRRTIVSHLNRHMGYHAMKCNKCNKKFYCFRAARKHLSRIHNV